MRITMKAMKSPSGFLGGLPGPVVWSHLLGVFLAKLKSTFLKRVSRVSCSSCLAGIHLLCDDLVHKIRDPYSQDKFFNLGTNQRARVHFSRDWAYAQKTLKN
jgi:hypothetical protein